MSVRILIKLGEAFGQGYIQKWSDFNLKVH